MNYVGRPSPVHDFYTDFSAKLKIDADPLSVVRNAWQVRFSPKSRFSIDIDQKRLIWPRK